MYACKRSTDFSWKGKSLPHSNCHPDHPLPHRSSPIIIHPHSLSMIPCKKPPNCHLSSSFHGKKTL
jgi:hypothetical protein